MDAAFLDAFGLDPDVLHLNHGAFGVAPVTVRRAAAAWRERAGYLRIAAAPYNTGDDYDRLASSVSELLDRQ